MTNRSVLVEVSVGELVDKITILEIKAERLEAPEKIANVRLELELLMKVQQSAVAGLPGIAELRARLKETNTRIWDIENQIRELERAGDFGLPFVEVARSVYRTNDERARLKREINELAGSKLVEEKSYAPY